MGGDGAAKYVGRRMQVGKVEVIRAKTKQGGVGNTGGRGEGRRVGKGNTGGGGEEGGGIGDDGGGDGGDIRIGQEDVVGLIFVECRQ